MALRKEPEEDDLCCSICLEYFDLARALFCGHSFCGRCLTKIQRKNKDQKYSVLCPECRCETQIPLQGLPINFGLNRLVEQLSGMTNVKILHSSMPPRMQADAKRCIFSATQNSSDVSQIAQQISRDFDKTYGGFWQCVIKTDDNQLALSASAGRKDGLKAQINDMQIELYKSAQQTACWKCASLLCNGESCDLGRPIVNKSKMPQTITEDAAKIAKEAVEMCKTANEMAKSIASYFNAKYNGPWHCIVTSGNKDQSGYFILNTAGGCIQITVANVNVTLFKTA